MEKSISEKFLNTVHEVLGDCEAYDRLASDMVKYDKPYFDKIDSPCVVSVSPSGSTQIVSASRFIHDLYLAKVWNNGGHDYTYYGFVSGDWKAMPLEAVQTYLYESAKVQKSITNEVIMPFNNLEGYIITWDRLLGTVPEEWRPQLEESIFDEAKGYYVQPLKDKLKGLYDYEVNRLLECARMRSKRVEIREEGADDTKWIDTTISKIGVSFEGFSPISEGMQQTTAFFQASDMSTDFNPEVRLNWHAQNTSRWLYSGAIALNFYGGKLTISSHH